MAKAASPFGLGMAPGVLTTFGAVLSTKPNFATATIAAGPTRKEQRRDLVDVAAVPLGSRQRGVVRPVDDAVDQPPTESVP